MSKPRLLDLFSGGGGATKGYQRAGFYVVGVDIAAQPNYCGDEFIQADALTFDLRGFDVIHASPPCQGYLSGALNQNSPRLLSVIRARIEVEAPDVIYVLENVAGARREMRTPIMLCGTMFPGTLKVYRHRFFESNARLNAPEHGNHLERFPCAGRGANENGWICVCGNMKNSSAGRAAMGISWMNRKELAEAIPPAYTECIGKQLIAFLENK